MAVLLRPKMCEMTLRGCLLSLVAVTALLVVQGLVNSQMGSVGELEVSGFVLAGMAGCVLLVRTMLYFGKGWKLKLSG